MRQNKNITIAYDLNNEHEMHLLKALEITAKSSNRSISQIAKIILELGLYTFKEILETSIKNEAK